MEKEDQTRDIELENIVGNLLIAEYQVERLRDRVVSRIDSMYPLTEKCPHMYSKAMTLGSKFHLM